MLVCETINQPRKTNQNLDDKEDLTFSSTSLSPLSWNFCCNVADSSAEKKDASIGAIGMVSKNKNEIETCRKEAVTKSRQVPKTSNTSPDQKELRH